MKPSFSPQWAFCGKISILWMLFSLNACVKDDITNISDNIMMEQSFAIPLGAKEIRVSKPPVSESSSAPGTYGTYYYDDLPYPNNTNRFTPSEAVNLNLSSNPNSNWIKKITFNILAENSFLIYTSLQIHLVDANGRILDRFFKNRFPVYGSSQNTDTIIFEGARLELLKQANILQYDLEISSTSTILRLTDENRLRVTVGATAELEYNVKELKN